MVYRKLYRVQHYERIRAPKVAALLNQNLTNVSKSVECITEFNIF